MFPLLHPARGGACACGLAILLSATPASAAPAPHRQPNAARQAALRGLQSAELLRAQRLAEAARRDALARQDAARAAALAAARIAAAAQLRGTEQAAATASGRLEVAAQAASRAAAEVARRRRAIAALLPAAVRLALYPDETLLGAPASPAETLAGLGVAQGIGIRLAGEIAALRDAEARNRALAAELAARRDNLAGLRLHQARQTAVLDREMSAAARASQDQDAAGMRAAREAASLASRAANLRDAIAAMDRAEADAARRRPAPKTAGPALARAAAGSPVAGRVVRGFGAPAEDGPATGMTIAALPGAVVTSPCAGRVGFAAPFRSYGKLLIVQCGGGRDFVLAGLDRLDAAVGSAVRAGEPVGRMPAAAADLYLELRERGTPTDPRPFL